MVTTLKPANQPQSESPTGEQRVVFNGISWAQYQQILTALPPSRAARLVYACGTLEISMPLEDHEQASEMINIFIRVLVLEMGLKLKSMGSTTLDRQDLDRGSEPDKAYYIQNQPLVAGRKVNLKKDPPPDLVVEIDITHTDIDKNRLYAAMGVPEFWRFDGHHLRIYQLQNKQYVEVEKSPTFSIIAKEDFYEFIDSARQDEISAEREFRAWVQKQLTNS
ncbi:MAG: Uma2 family endonuclease [Cyanobacteria bacterium J06627_28]